MGHSGYPFKTGDEVTFYWLITLALFGEREREREREWIKLLGMLGVKAKCLRTYLQHLEGMAPNIALDRSATKAG